MFVQATKTVFEELPFILVSLPTIIPWAKRVEIMSAEDDIVYRDGTTGSHFAVGGIDQIITPCQVSSFIIDVPKLSMAALRVWSSLICS